MQSILRCGRHVHHLTQCVAKDQLVYWHTTDVWWAESPGTRLWTSCTSRSPHKNWKSFRTWSWNLTITIAAAMSLNASSSIFLLSGCWILHTLSAILWKDLIQWTWHPLRSWLASYSPTASWRPCASASLQSITIPTSIFPSSNDGIPFYIYQTSIWSRVHNPHGFA